MNRKPRRLVYFVDVSLCSESHCFHCRFQLLMPTVRLPLLPRNGCCGWMMTELYVWRKLMPGEKQLMRYDGADVFFLLVVNCVCRRT